MAVKRTTDEVHDTSELLARLVMSIVSSLPFAVAALVGCVSPSANPVLSSTRATIASHAARQKIEVTAPPPLERLPAVELVSHIEPSPDAGPGGTEWLPAPVQIEHDKFPIDLPTALQLAGANNLQIALASERVEQAYAGINAADARWVPSLNLGVVYNQHDGQLQAVLEGDQGCRAEMVNADTHPRDRSGSRWQLAVRGRPSGCS